nr:hypothetical protein [Kineococcus aurantiacus]
MPGESGCPRWVVEDDFADGRPPLDRVGVRFVPSTVPHELLRTRLHDGAHDALAVAAAAAGARTAGAALAVPGVREFLEGFLAEAAQQVLGVPADELDEYRAAVLARLAADPGREPHVPGPERFRADVLPSLRQAVDHDGPRERLVQALAGWLLATGGPGGAADLLRRHHDVLGTLADEPHLPAELQRALHVLTPSSPTPAEFS